MTEDMPIVMFSDVIGYPSPWVAWIRNGQVLQNKTNGKNYILYGRHATIEDAGNYTCMAGNFAGVTSFTYQLIIRSTYFNLKVKCLKDTVKEFHAFTVFIFASFSFLLWVTLTP